MDCYVNLLVYAPAGKMVFTSTTLCYNLSDLRPAGWVELDITEAMRNWQSGDPNYGVLLLATNEDALGRDTRFYSNADDDASHHAYVNVLCQ